MAGNDDFLGPAVDDEHIIKLSDVYAKKTDVDDTYAKKTVVENVSNKVNVLDNNVSHYPSTNALNPILNILKQLITLDVTHEWVSDDDDLANWYFGHVVLRIKSNVVGLYYEIINKNRGIEEYGYTTSTDQTISSLPYGRFSKGYEIKIRLPNSTIDLYYASG